MVCGHTCHQQSSLARWSSATTSPPSMPTLAALFVAIPILSHTGYAYLPSWLSSPPHSLVGRSTAISPSATVLTRSSQDGGGSALLFNSKHCKHTALFAQAINLVAWSSIENAYGALSHTYARLADAGISAGSRFGEASALLDSARCSSRRHDAVWRRRPHSGATAPG